MMTVEYLDKKGFWACPEGKANHGWDCSGLALAAHVVLGVKFWPRTSNKEIIRKEIISGVAKSRFIHGQT